MKLNEKYVLHIPLSRFCDNKLESIEIDEILNDLIKQLEDRGYNSFYITNVTSYYKFRKFGELLITVFTSKTGGVDLIFKWFKKNNDVLKQEAFSYEHQNRMIIEKCI